MNARELQACADRLEKFLMNMLASVGRAERRHHGSQYVQGLLLDGERKSIEPLAARVPGGNVQALQQFVGQSPWAWEPVRRVLAQHLEEKVLPTVAWIIDDTGFAKQGRDSVGVARQYSGTLGKVGNCQVAVGVHLATEAESAPLGTAAATTNSLGCSVFLLNQTLGLASSGTSLGIARDTTTTGM
jgi:SRSO17 transposase